jgi:hypothetical protein
MAKKTLKNNMHTKKSKKPQAQKVPEKCWAYLDPI